MPRLMSVAMTADAVRAVLALGVVAHDTVVRAFGLKPSRMRFRHGALHELPSGVVLADSYHVSRYNTNTGVLTQAMFEDVVSRLAQLL